MECKMIQEFTCEDIVYVCSNCKSEFVDETGFLDDWHYCSFCGSKITEFIPCNWEEEYYEYENY
jgi:DNA-directed RNA polymerase subunit RPC12/RpoP